MVGILCTFLFNHFVVICVGTIKSYSLNINDKSVVIISLKGYLCFT